MRDLFDRFLRILALAAGIVLIGLMLFTVADVFLRYGFNLPFRSVFEFTEFSMALIVFLAIAYTGWTGGHIAVDVFASFLDRPSLRFLPPLLALVGSALFAIIAYRSTLETIATLDQTSNLLRWPHYPFRFTVAFGSAMFAIVLFVQAIDAWRNPAVQDKS
jgi:TRAP-type C4-dicarboxylate transport system permease small subunit